ncbi:MAG: transglycosylase SLT domain-containing protein [Steroidobacteraceae bacterium]
MLLPFAAQAAEERLPRPPELQRDVDFWIRVYSEISNSEGFLHDEYDLSLVYRTLKFTRDVQPRERRDAVAVEREKIETMLKHLAAGATDLSDDEKKLAALFGPDATAARYLDASRQVRFQLGQSDRFREGLERSGTWEAHIAQTFANLGLPPELAALPHVESSFDPTAYSKVGAAGLWQFMPGTGRRYLRVNAAVDERLDPFRATEAAAQLLDFNFRFLNNWALALTAYNHGAAGMRRARDSLGTDDIAVIVRKYKSASFGFASRNFYVSFLAALTIDRNPEKYFGNLKRNPQMAFTEVEMPAYVPLAALQRTLKVDRSSLVALNPALRPPVWNGSQYVPKGYKLRLPVEAKSWTGVSLAQQLDATDQYVNQPRERSYRARAGDTLATVARRNGVGINVLAKLNGMEADEALRARQTLRLPGVPATRVVLAKAEAAAGLAVAANVPATTPSETLAEQRAETLAVAKQQKKDAQPVTASEARAESPSLVPGGAVASTSESIDYSIGADNTIRVIAEETLGHYAQWLNVPASRLRALNRLSATAAVPLGRRLTLDFSNTSREQFEVRRREYHDAFQAAFFADHRIVGTRVYVTRRGDSLWGVSQRNGGLPAWLVLHYNPDIDFIALRAGLEIVIPRVEAQPAT